MTFSDFRYIGAKRYAEKDKKTGEWEIKCCGLTDRIMKQVKDIDTFCLCPIPQKELNKMQLYTKDEDDPNYQDIDVKLDDVPENVDEEGNIDIDLEPFEIIGSLPQNKTPKKIVIHFSKKLDENVIPKIKLLREEVE